jgi:hypothetical protein
MASLKSRLDAYKKTYEVDDLVNPNDLANLYALIRNQEIIETVQAKIDELVTDDTQLLNNIGNIKKLQDSLLAMIDQNLAIERALGIDRKSRKKDTQEDVGTYITHIRKAALDFLQKEFITLYCEDCKVLVGRVLPAHEYTEFSARFQCSQCNKMIEVKRKERDIFFDSKERNMAWRRKYKAEIIQGRNVELDDDEEEQIVIEE